MLKLTRLADNSPLPLPTEQQSSSTIKIVQKNSIFAKYTKRKRSWMYDGPVHLTRSVETQTETETIKRAKEYSNEVLSYSTQILYSSRRAYKFLRQRNLLKLPHPSTIYRHLSSFICLPGINEQLLRLVSLKVLTFEEKDRNGIQKF